MRLARIIAASGLFAALSAASPAPERCVLRVALVQGNAAQATRAADGSYRGIAVDVAKHLGKRWHRRVTLTAMTPPEILAALGRREIDLGFVAVNPDRGGAVVYSRPYMLVQQTALVSAASPLRSVGELDGPGTAIGANTGDSVAGYLNRTLTRSTVKTSADITLAEAVKWLGDGTVVAFAGNRQRLGMAARTHGNVRLLPDNFYAVSQAIAVVSGDPVMIGAVDMALDDLQRSGKIARAIRRSGVAGVVPAPLDRTFRPSASPAAPAHTRC